MVSGASAVFPASFVAFFAVSVWVLCAHKRPTQPQVGLGAVTESTAVVWFLTSDFSKSNSEEHCSAWNVTLHHRAVDGPASTEEQIRRIRQTSNISLATDGWSNTIQVLLQGRAGMSSCTQVITIAGLQPSTSYEFLALFDAASNAKSAQPAMRVGSFHTTVEKGQSTMTTFITGSCLLTLHLEMRPLKSLMGADLFMLIGDAVYSDMPWAMFRKYEALYLALMRDTYFAALTANTPLLTMYDDHEVGNNWMSGTDLPYPSAIGNWSWFLGARNPTREVRGDGVSGGAEWAGPHYFTHQIGDIAFFVLDVRRYRRGETMLGAEQRDELRQWLLAGGAATCRQAGGAGGGVRLKVVVSPVPMTRNIGEEKGSVGTDGWEWFGAEKQAVLAWMRAWGGAVLVLSGDMHWSGVFEVGERIYEASASPLFQVPLPLWATRTVMHDRCLFSSAGRLSFSRVTVDTTSSDGRVHLEIVEATLRGVPNVLWSRNFTLSELTPAS